MAVRPSDPSVVNLGALQADDAIPIDRAGVNAARKTTPADILAFIQANTDDGIFTPANTYIGPTQPTDPSILYWFDTNGQVVPQQDVAAPVVTAFTLPATSDNLTFSVSSFTASDAIGVTAFIVTENSTPPSAGSAGWTSSAPATITASGSGAKTFYPWAKDAAGNVSTVFGAPRDVTITLTDVTAPVVTGFTVSASSDQTLVTGITVSATDTIGINGWVITESSTPPASGAAGWTAIGSTTSFSASNLTYQTSGAGTFTLYVWVKDTSNNVSALYTSRQVTITPVGDQAVPTLSVFTVPANVTNTLIVTGITITASDDIGVTAWIITETATPPNAGAGGWNAVTPTVNYSASNLTYTAGSTGTKTLYAWVKDAADKISAVFTSRSCTITDSTAPVISEFTIPATATSASILLTITATDNMAGIIQYYVGENATLGGGETWVSVKPTTFMFTGLSIGVPTGKTLYLWAKDSAGNISARSQASVTITLADTFPDFTDTFARGDNQLSNSITTGTVSITSGNDVIEGVGGTYFTGDAVIGQYLIPKRDGISYKITEVISDSQVRVTPTPTETVSGETYRIGFWKSPGNAGQFSPAPTSNNNADIMGPQLRLASTGATACLASYCIPYDKSVVKRVRIKEGAVGGAIPSATQFPVINLRQTTTPAKGGPVGTTGAEFMVQINIQSDGSVGLLYIRSAGALPMFWNGTTWTTTQASLALSIGNAKDGTDHFYSIESNGTQFRLVVYAADGTTILLASGWRDWSLVNFNGTTPVYVETGDFATDAWGLDRYVTRFEVLV